MFIIRENHNGRSQIIMDAGKMTSRGYIRDFKVFKTESAAKAWISRRMKDIEGLDGWEYTIETK